MRIFLERKSPFATKWNGLRPCLLTAPILVLGLAAGCGPNYERLANLDAPGETIVCLGDSITRGFGASPGQDYPALLERNLGVPVVNAGVDGNTTADALRRLDEDVLALQPRLVIVFLGGNDLLRQRGADAALEDLDAIVRRCAGAGAMVALVHARFGLFRDPYRSSMEEIADRHGALFIPNVLSGILGRPARSTDAIHPNDEGYRLIAGRLAEAVTPLLQTADAHRRNAM